MKILALDKVYDPLYYIYMYLLILGTQPVSFVFNESNRFLVDKQMSFLAGGISVLSSTVGH